MRRLRYTLNDDPEEFIEQIRDLLSVVEPEYTDRKFCEIILEKIPIDLSLKLANWGATDDTAKLAALYIMRMGKKSKRSVTGMRTHPQNLRQLNEDNVRRKDENVRFTNTNATRSLINPLKITGQKRCFKCNQVVHLQRNCISQNTALKDKEVKEEKETNQRIEIDSQSLVKYVISFAVQMEIPREATRKLEPFVKVTIMELGKTKIGEAEALIDTGSHVNIMSKDYAVKNK